MRTIYYTQELNAAVKHYRERNSRKMILWFFLLIPWCMVLAGWSLADPNAYVFIFVMYAGEGFACLVMRPDTWKWLHRRRDEPRPLQLMLDAEKVAVEEDGARVTIRLDDITRITEIRGHLMLQGEPGVLIVLPKDQLLEDEFRLLDEVKDRLQRRA